jgi:hypothetical protein
MHIGAYGRKVGHDPEHAFGLLAVLIVLFVTPVFGYFGCWLTFCCAGRVGSRVAVARF